MICSALALCKWISFQSWLVCTFSFVKSSLWRRTFLRGTLLEHSFLFILIRNISISFQIIPFQSKWFFFIPIHTFYSCFLGSFKGLFQDLLWFFLVVFFYLFVFVFFLCFLWRLLTCFSFWKDFFNSYCFCFYFHFIVLFFKVIYIFFFLIVLFFNVLILNTFGCFLDFAIFFFQDFFRVFKAIFGKDSNF